MVIMDLILLLSPVVCAREGLVEGISLTIYTGAVAVVVVRMVVSSPQGVWLSEFERS
jgi:hypothetical protein